MQIGASRRFPRFSVTGIYEIEREDESESVPKKEAPRGGFSIVALG